MVKPGFIYSFNVKTNFCVKTTQYGNSLIFRFVLCLFSIWQLSEYYLCFLVVVLFITFAVLVQFCYYLFVFYSIFAIQAKCHDNSEFKIDFRHACRFSHFSPHRG